MKAGTIVASNYLEMARILAETFLQHHRDSGFAILVVDDHPVADLGDGVEILRLADLALDEHALDVMRTVYEVREFSTAVKPALLRRLLDDDPVACYLDPDIMVYAPFDDVLAHVERQSILLTPHVLQPVPRDGLDVSERTLMLSGMYNLGFAAVGRSALPFLEWWQQRLLTDAVIDFDNGLFTDQRWVDWVAALFPHDVCRDPGMNVAWWNLHERQLHLIDGHPFAGDAPVRFVHFSGYDPSTPDTLCKWQPKPRLPHDAGTPMRVLAEAYGDRLIGRGHPHRATEPYQWDLSDDGIPLSPDLRRMWRDELVAELIGGTDLQACATPPPVGDPHPELRPWLEAASGGTREHPHARVERLVWQRRADLQAAFPDIDGVDAERFRDWLDFEPDAWRELTDYSPVCADHHRPRPAAPAPPARGMAGSVLARSRRLVGRSVRFSRRLAKRLIPSAGAGSEQMPDALRPLAFLHIPKCAGSSIKAVLQPALSGHRWAPWVFDPSQFGPLRDAVLTPELQAETVPTPDALIGYQAAVGHYSLPTLLVAFDPADVVTVLREPRCRLLSHHQYWRSLTDQQRLLSGPWADMTRTAQRQEFGDWLADPAVAYQTDNLFIRQLAPDHPAIPAVGFIADDDVEALVSEGIRLLGTLGWVDVVERGQATWDDLGKRVGTTLVPIRANVTERGAALVNDAEQVVGAAATANLAARTRIDARLWSWAASARGVGDVDSAAQAAWEARTKSAIGSVGR